MRYQPCVLATVALLRIGAACFAQPPMDQSPLDKLDPKEAVTTKGDAFLPEVVALIPGTTRATVMDLAFSPDNKRLALARSDNTIELWDLTDRKPKHQVTLKPDDGERSAFRVAFSPNGAWMASVHGIPGKKLHLWKLAGESEPKKFASYGLNRIDNVIFHPNNRMLVAGANAGHLIQIDEKGLNDLGDVFPNANCGFTFAPDGRTFASAVFNPARNGPLYASEFKVWSLRGADATAIGQAQQERTIKAVALSPDGKLLATGSLDLKVRFWDLTANPPTPLAPFSMENWVRAVYFTPDGAYLVAVANVGHVVLWNCKESKQAKAWMIGQEKLGGELPFSASTLAPDGRHLALAVSMFNDPFTLILRLPTPTGQKRR